MRIGIFILLLGFLVPLKAGIYCPDNVSIDCNHDYYNLSIVGEATGFGNHINGSIKYTDVKSISACNVGNIQRIWYVDLNLNSNFDQNEPNCTQSIDISYLNHPFSVSFPQDLYLDCNDDIPESTPEWISGPCDQVAYSVKEENFQGFSNSCSVIQRRYTVINWCQYSPNDPNWNGGGIFTAIQLIHLNDNSAPEIMNCNDVELALESDCMTEISLSMSANDINDCGTGLLAWFISVDLWGDGMVDYNFSPLETGVFFLDKVMPGESISINVPERVGAGLHKVSWKVVDFCGNVDNCTQEVRTVDSKPPTPYCLLSTQAVVTGTQKPIALVASSFDRGGFDNCSEDLSISFSTDPSDSIRLLDCTDLGFQFSRIYYIDAAGNSDYCSVAYFVMDNGKCASNREFSGSVVGLLEEPMSNLKMEAYLDNNSLSEALVELNGTFTLSDLPLHEDLLLNISSTVENTNDQAGIEDLVILKDYVIGQLSEPLTEQQKWLADVNQDNRINARDLIELKKLILLSDYDLISSLRLISRRDFEDSLFNYQIANSPNLLDYNGSFDLLSIPNGNVSHDYFNDNVEGVNQPAAQLHIEENTELSSFTLLAEENLLYDGIQLEFTLAGEIDELDEVITSDVFDFTNDSELVFENGNTRVKLIKATNQALEILNNQVIFHINSNYNIIDWKDSNRIVLKSSTELVVTKLKLNRPEVATTLESFKIYPNPSYSQQISVQYSEIPESIRVFDREGSLVREVLKEASLKDSLELTLPKGVYIIQYILGDIVEAKKLVVI